MRILIAHNAYRYRGGEDSVVEAETELLRSRGHAIEVYSRHSDELANQSSIAAACQTIWSDRTLRDLSRSVRHFQPDLIHCHNTFPLISPSLYWAAARAAVPVVQTLHNFRLMCLNAFFMRKGRVCEDCLGRVPWRGVVHRCYRQSGAASSVLAGMLGFHRTMDTYKKKISRYIALNDFCRSKFIEGGLPAERIVVKPNFVALPPPDFSAPRQGMLFVGRLSAEKGISTLAAAMKRVPEADVAVVGDGPDADPLVGLSNIRRTGFLDPTKVHSEMRRASCLIMPSMWYETFGLVALEAFACGLPVIASRLGAMAELVQDGVTGLLFEPGNADDLAAKLRWALGNPDALRRMGQAARHEYEAKYTPDRNYAVLMNIYDQVIEEFGRSR